MKRIVYRRAPVSNPAAFPLARGHRFSSDEIGDNALNAAKRASSDFLEQGEVQRWAETTTSRVDVTRYCSHKLRLEEARRAATVPSKISNYVWQSFPSILPPLRKRFERRRSGTGIYRQGSSPATHAVARGSRRLMQHSWPGNVRELRNAIEAGHNPRGGWGRINGRAHNVCRSLGPNWAISSSLALIVHVR